MERVCGGGEGFVEVGVGVGRRPSVFKMQSIRQLSYQDVKVFNLLLSL